MTGSRSFKLLLLVCSILIGVHAFTPSYFGGKFNQVISTQHSFHRIDKSVISATEKSTVSFVQSKTYRLDDTLQNDSSGNRILFKSEADDFSITISQKTTGVVPRSYLPTFLNIVDAQDGREVEKSTFLTVFEDVMRWYLDYGGRVSQLKIHATDGTEKLLSGLIIASGERDDDLRKYFTVGNSNLRQHCRQRLVAKEGNAHTLHDIIGRLEHDVGDPKSAIKSYTAALQENSQVSSTFRNLGSAYHAVGDMQLALASYQQAIQLDPKGMILNYTHNQKSILFSLPTFCILVIIDGSVYLKLAFFYEDLASRDWNEAGDHSQKCYHYYLENVDPTDTAILMRLGNLLIKEHKPEEVDLLPPHILCFIYVLYDINRFSF